MTVNEIMTELQAKGSESIKKILLKHGIKEPFFGVKVEYLKIIQKKIKKDYLLAKELYATGNADAMYLAGLIADDEKMTKADLEIWVKQAVSTNISEYTVPWVAAGSPYGFEMALKWINDQKEHIAAAGWCTLSNLAALLPDEQLEIPAFKKLLKQVEKNIHSSANRVRHTMNGFVIATGIYITALTDDAIATAQKAGAIYVDMNGTACKVPSAMDAIDKIKNKGALGKKKKMVKC